MIEVHDVIQHFQMVNLLGSDSTAVPFLTSHNDGTDLLNPFVSILTGGNQTLWDDIAITFLPDKPVGGDDLQSFIVDKVAGANCKHMEAMIPTNGFKFGNVAEDMSEHSVLLSCPRKKKEK